MVLSMRKPKQFKRAKEKSEAIAYRPSVHPLVASYLRRDGAEDSDIANAIGITVATLRSWARVHPAFNTELKNSATASLETVVRALLKSATGHEFTDTERVYEFRKNPVTREVERVLIRERENLRRALPNPIACFFYLQNRDSLRWQPAGAKSGGGSPFTPEQISTMMRSGGQAISDATLGEGLNDVG